MGGFLTIGYGLPIAFWNFLWGDKALMEGNKVVMGDPQSPTRENPGFRINNLTF